MPVARSWVEEFVAQYLILRGYPVRTDVDIGPGSTRVERTST